MELGYDLPAEAYVDVVQRVFTEGYCTNPRGMETRELLNVQINIEQPSWVPFSVPDRGLNERIAIVEILSLIGQTPTDALARYSAGALANFHDAGIAYGSYGARLRGQLTNVVRTLMVDPNSRRAVMTIYHGPADLCQDTKDIPCTLTAQFLIRDGALYTRVNMRSNDVWLGLPYDLMQFCALHCAMAQVMDVEVGPYCHAVGSLHLYGAHYDRAEQLTDHGIESEGSYPLFTTKGANALERLEDVTTFCQDIIHGRLPVNGTRFERWLASIIPRKAMQWG